VSVLEWVGVASVLAWIYLLFGRGGFWRVRETAPRRREGLGKSVAVVAPARNEEAVVGRAIDSLLKQKYDGPLHVFLVDDHSTDATVAAAGIDPRLSIVQAAELPAGWTGKLWAISQGLDRAEALKPDYFLLTDADIVHAADSIAGLVARAEAGGLDLVSYMVKLHCRTLAERALIPAFVFFFFMLYPPTWIANVGRATAGAAGGCILIRPRALSRIGGIASIRGELIDDCALAAAVKQDGRIWLGLTSSTLSIREYSTFGEISRMISRTAFTQLRHSVLLLAGTVVGLAIIYLSPLLVLAGDRTLGLTAWLLMTIAYIPTLRFYRQSLLWAPALPAIAMFYLVATIQSAIQYWNGRGGAWKGRVQLPRGRR
jgi:hopene-associated glycosyltransferase HpnB